MPLKLMYITNNTQVARVMEEAGCDRIFIDMEYIGKDDRQANIDSVKNHHTISDIENMRKVLKRSELLVRINPIHDTEGERESSEEEIERVIAAGADIIMLPYYSSMNEVERFVGCVAGRVKTILLLETPGAVGILDQVLERISVDGIHIGINDLSICYGKKFMFELLADGTVEQLCSKLKYSGIPYGFGGIASIGNGKIPAEIILKEHYRLGSSMVILSRSFCDIDNEADFEIVKTKLQSGIKTLRDYEKEIFEHREYFSENERLLREYVTRIVNNENTQC